MKSSKHVETCFVRANNDFDDKLTAFWMKNIFWTKIPKKRTLWIAEQSEALSLKLSDEWNESNPLNLIEYLIIIRVINNLP